MKMEQKLQTKTENDLGTQIQDKFMEFKKAEQGFIELLKQVDNEEQFVDIITKLKEIDNRLMLVKKPTEELPNYIG